MLDSVLIASTITALLFMFANILRYRLIEAGGMLFLFTGLLFWVVRRTKKELGEEDDCE